MNTSSLVRRVLNTTKSSSNLLYGALSTTTSQQRFNSTGRNRAVVYQKPGVVSVENVAYPKLELPAQGGRK